MDISPNLSPNEYYQLRESSQEKLLGTLRKQSTILSMARLILFAGGIGACIFVGLNFNSFYVAVSILLSVFAMLALVKYHVKLANKIAITQSLVTINQKEQACLRHDFSTFADGKWAIDYQHPYSSDLDIFGENSLFQYLNRTVTPFGSKHLELSLKTNNLSSEKIAINQAAINELAAKANWRQAFMAEGQQVWVDTAQVDRLFNWFTTPDIYSNRKFILWMVWVSPILTLSSLIYGIIISNYALFTLLAIVQVFAIMLCAKTINEVHQKVSQMHQTLQSFSLLFKTIEKETFVTEKLKELQITLGKNQHGAAYQLKKLSGILNAFDTRLNILAAIPLNTLFLFDLHSVIRLERWKKNNVTDCKTWFETLGEFEKLQSFANYSFNNPLYCYPTLSTTKFTLQAENLGHPLIPTQQRVTNNFGLEGKGSMAILTGANMAGKSTFLRTVGINMVLAMAGAPVCADKFVLCPINIRTSINVRDSLKGNESYFYAELQRLKSIIDTLLKGEDTFIILDEILKGTNSNDKLKGSFALLTRLKDMQVSGIIATHDITLSELEQQFSSNFKNYCFEVSLDNDFLYYDYKLRQGVCKNLNASLLMKKMGIV